MIVKALNVKEAILVAGTSLLQEKGIAALTQPQVAKAANVKQSHLTYYFPTRADLLLGIAERSITMAMAMTATRLSEKPQQATLLSTLAEVMVSGVPPRVIIGLIVAADAEPDIRKSLRKLIKHVRIQIRSLLAAAGLTADADTVLLFHASVVGLAIMHQARMNKESAREVKDGVAALMRLLSPLPQHVETGD